MKALIFYTILFQNLNFTKHDAGIFKYRFYTFHHDSLEQNDYALFKFDSLGRMYEQEFRDKTNEFGIKYEFNRDTITNEKWLFNGQVIYSYSYFYYKNIDTSIVVRSDSLVKRSFPVTNGMIYRCSKKCKPGATIGLLSGSYIWDLMEKKVKWCGNSTDSTIFERKKYVKHYIDPDNRYLYTLETNSSRAYNQCEFFNKILMDANRNILKLVIDNYIVIFKYKNNNIYKMNFYKRTNGKYLFRGVLEANN